MAYPIDFRVEYQEGKRSRGYAVLGIIFFLKGVLLIPHFVVLYVVGIVTMVAAWFGYWAILFTGRQPDGIRRLAGGTVGWGTRVTAWLISNTDAYPPFRLWPDAHPAVFTAEADDRPRNRWLALSGILLLKPLIALPHLLIVGALQWAVWIVAYVSYWIIAFTGTLPEGIHDFTVSVQRWSARTSGWILSLTDDYPPFAFEQ